MVKWVVVDFDCSAGCNNPEFNPGCDESSIRIKIDVEMDKRFGLFKKYMDMPCPRCGKLVEQKRSGWWYTDTDKNRLKDHDGSTFSAAEIQDYTSQMLKAKEMELADEIKEHQHAISKLRDILTDLKKTEYS